MRSCIVISQITTLRSPKEIIMPMQRSYLFQTPRGTTSKRFWSLREAFSFLKPDSPDLEPRDLVGRNPGRPLLFVDGYRFFRKDVWVSN